MATFSHAVGTQTYRFDSLKELMAKASPARSGDFLAGVAAHNDGERVAAQMALADIPLSHFLQEALIPYEADEVTRLIIDSHDAQAFAAVSHLTVGAFVTGCSVMPPMNTACAPWRQGLRLKWQPLCQKSCACKT